MAADSGFYTALATPAIGFILFACGDTLIRPRPSFRRPLSAWAAMLGIWSIVQAFLILFLGRVWCACAAGLAMSLVLVLVHNAKQKSMAEPFLFQDYDYFLDTLRFPRLFLPFLGLKSFCIAAFFCVLAIGAIALEPVPVDRWSFHGQLGGVFILLGTGSIALGFSLLCFPPLALDPQKDLHNFGQTAFLWFYGIRNITLPQVASPFATAIRGRAPELPNLVAFQSESFFDPRTLVPGIAPELLKNFDALAAASFLHGNLHVPAWGANTARTEFAFLSGIFPGSLGMHQFNPYQTMLRGWLPASLPAFLRSLGYGTVCIHPYHSAFYGRKKIFPDMGFEEFMDIRSFSQKAGSYISDMELATRIVEVLRERPEPVFIFAISMENHGPLHLEKQPDARFTRAMLPGVDTELCPELPIYLNHVRHTDDVAAYFAVELGHARPVSLCFYGDHVPIMPRCYASFGYPPSEVPYFCWANFMDQTFAAEDLPASALARHWLKDLGIAKFDEN